MPPSTGAMAADDASAGLDELDVHDAHFEPPAWLRNPHTQTLLNGLPLRRPWLRRWVLPMLSRAEEHVIDCGAGVRLHGERSTHPGPGERDLVVLLHGWEGSSRSVYLLSAAGFLFEQGFDVFRLHLRDHGSSHHLNRELFHGCRLDEVVGAIRQIQKRFARGRVFVAGFSLGGNFALRIAAHGPAAGCDLTRVVAISPVLHPQRTIRALEAGPAIYHGYFMRKWRRSLLRKGELFPGLLDPHVVRRTRSMMALTEYFVPLHTPFPDAAAYLQGYAVVGDVLANLSVPTHLITASDDPVNPVEDLALLARPATLDVRTESHGGHCGFIDDPRQPGWVDRQLVRLFKRDAI